MNTGSIGVFVTGRVDSHEAEEERTHFSDPS